MFEFFFFHKGTTTLQSSEFFRYRHAYPCGNCYHNMLQMSPHGKVRSEGDEWKTQKISKRNPKASTKHTHFSALA